MKRSTTILAAIAALIAWTGIASAQSKPWRHGVLEPKSDSGFILMATQNDFARKHGLDLQIVSLKNETLGLRALIAGDLDSYEGSPPYAAIVRGADVKEIGCPWQPVPHVIFARVGIDSMRALDGKTMASSAPGSMPDLVGRTALDHFGVAPGRVTLANVGSDSDRYRSLLGGVVDAAVISSEYTPIVDNTKVHILTKASEVAPEFLRICYQSSARVLAARPDDAARFLATEMEALAFALGHRDATIALAQKSTGQKPDDPRPGFVFDEVTRLGQIDPNLPIPADKIGAMQATLLRLGVIAKTVDVAGMIDTGPRLRALQMMGH